MQVGLRWLRDYVEIDVEADALARRLSESLTETYVVPLPSDTVRGVVAGRVVSVDRHPNADRLSVCVVDAGERTYTVVCGAPNVRSGMSSALAPPGSTVAEGRTISEATIRGARSQGMLVSEVELGLEGSADGIIELPDDVVPGADLSDHLGYGDAVFEIDVQPNRPDCMGVLGIAREVAAVLDRPLTLPATDLVEDGPAVEELASVSIEDTDGCPRYIARVISGLSVGPSPAWLAVRLRSAGLRSISNIVDVTNFVMLEYGHPIHAFDLALLPEGRIVVRRARSGERITTLDGEEHALIDEDLLITDGKRPVALAGVMGAENSEVSASTTDVLLECAWFDPVTVRRTARRLGLRTDASQRFERGVDPAVMDQVASRASELMRSLGAGTVAVGAADEGVMPPERPRRGLRTDSVRRLIDPGIGDDEIVGLLDRLGLEPEATGETVTVTIPTHRRDLETEADLVEEVARLRGFECVEAFVPYRDIGASGGDLRAARRSVLTAMLSFGFQEVLTTSFMSERSRRLVDGEAFSGGEPVRITNPMNKEMPWLRTALLPAMLNVVRHNLNVGNHELRLTEVGKVYRTTPEGVDEAWRLGAVLSGPHSRPGWSGEQRSVDLYDGLGILSGLTEALGVDTPVADCYDGSLLDRAEAARIRIGGSDVGVVGSLSSDVRERLDVSQPVVILEVELEPWLRVPQVVGQYRRLPRFPKVRRDVALILDESTPAGDVLREIENAEEELLVDVRIFDAYQGDQLPDGRKSLGLSLTYMSEERTLTDEEVERAHGRIVRRLVDGFQAELRGS
ncbi:MAG: phenylalanine--tRNA ligase subunit beta [Candidatus Eisenbacteria bacterium]|nr:phenylalanine--tRNA ligase subunit beta [Candidatus Eisenbacteria bacterium]